MKLNGLILTLPNELKVLIGAFVIVLSVGFYTGLLFVGETSSANPNGIEEQYLGNENDEDAEVMRFKKSAQEMLTLVHNHILSMSIIFFLLGILVAITKLNKKLKLFLMVEPFLSVLLTFGGLYLLWRGLLWMKYIVMISGILMTLTFTFSAFIVLKQLLQNNK
jgi:cellulose synthase/poly-beta-1,6-N-acetylglucosamine synthase-like glycosyltransferase